MQGYVYNSINRTGFFDSKAEIIRHKQNETTPLIVFRIISWQLSKISSVVNNFSEISFLALALPVVLSL